MIPDLKGFGSELALLMLVLYIILVILLIVLKVIPVSKKAWESKKTQTVELIHNPGTQPGDAEICKNHMKKLTELETKFDLKVLQICEQVNKIERINREDHRLIFEKMDDLRNRIGG